MLKLKLQYFGHLTQRTDSFEKTLMLGKIEGGEEDNRGWDVWMASPIQWTWVWLNSRSRWWTGRPGVLQSMVSQRVEHGWMNWTEPGFCCKNTYIAWLLPFLFRTDPQSSLRGYLLGLSLQYICQIKHNSLTFILCFFPVNSTNCSVWKGKLNPMGSCAFCDTDDPLWPGDQI